MFNIDEWRKYVEAVQANPEDYTAQDRHLVDLLLEVIADRETILNDYLAAHAHIRVLEHKVNDLESQVSYYRSRA